VTAASWRNQIRAESGVGVAGRLLGSLLLLVMVIGSFGLWVGVPAAALWGLGKVTSDPIEHLVLGLIAVPLGMVLFGLVLAFLNTAYLRVNGVSFAASDDESEWRPRLRGPLDRIIGISAVICLGAFLGWLVFGSAGVGPAGP
jgi:hypothetical protein